MSESFKFHVKTKSSVDRILIFSTEDKPLTCGELLGEMVLVQENEQESKESIWNGTLAHSKVFDKKLSTIILHMLGGEGHTEYAFNTLFSKPLSVDKLKKLAASNTLCWHNTVIVNVPKDAPQSIKAILLDIPPAWQKFWKLSPIEILTQIPHDKLKLNLANPSDYFKHGFDHNAQSWIRDFDLMIPNRDLIAAMNDDSLAELFRIKISVCIYISQKKFKITF